MALQLIHHCNFKPAAESSGASKCMVLCTACAIKINVTVQWIQYIRQDGTGRDRGVTKEQ